ncbi:MAG: Nramp family divalent metal transporter [Candidatus Magasanikbacteria bacterium]
MLKKQSKSIPKPPPFRKLLGPSFILLGLGLGSGEVILWPYLSSNWGLGIAWGALVGIFFQFFINMEIERYSLARGESVFIGLARRWKWVPFWLIFSTMIGFGWPGIIASSGALFASVFGGTGTVIAIVFLLLIGLILSFGKYIYNTVERFAKLIILIGIPSVFILTIYFAKGADWAALGQGLIGKGGEYWFLPAGIPIAVFLAAFAFSGAGGNLNLTQSSYIREKGYGMGAFTEKIKGLFGGTKQKIDLNGFEFHPTKENLSRFESWWKSVNKEHFFVFFLTGLITMSFLLLLSYSTTFGLAGNAEGINFVINEGRIIASKTFPALGSIFLILMGIMLFSTQFSVMDSTSRIMSENYAAIRSHEERRINLSKIYFAFLWAQIAFGILVFSLGFTEPLSLLILSAVINAVCMFVHIGLVNWLNYRELPKEIQPKIWRRIIIIFSFIFFGIFSVVTIWDRFF